LKEDAWLSERLGCPVVTVEEGDDPAALPAGAFCQAKVDCGDVARVGVLEAAGFRVIDVNVTLRREPVQALPALEGWRIEDAGEPHRDGVLTIAGGDYDVSRFHLDPAIESERADAIKRDWADAALAGARGDGMLVAVEADDVSGFLAIASSPEAAVIDLIAVRSRDRGRGAGRALVTALVERAGRPVDVGTQISNVRALALYERLGFLTVSTRYVLHRQPA
jgi:dTDP-4-amino-4,6-dideoxy-D-galactose acyltransferase